MADDKSKNKNGVKKRKVSDEFQEDAIFQPPVIIREPSSRQARLGSNVVLRISASGKPLPSFQWFHNGKKISGANTDRLTLSKLRRSSAGAYHCEAKNHAGHAASRPCMLSFFTQKVPKLVLDNRELMVEEGKPIILKVVCSDASAFKDFRVFWVFNGMRIKGAHGLELSIGAGKKKYEGEYKAMISVGSGIETSNLCKVTVVPAKQTAMPPPLPKSSANEAQEEGTMVGLLAPTQVEEPVVAEVIEPMASPEPPTSNWADFLFNPDEEIENSEADDLSSFAKEEDGTLLAEAQPSPLDLVENLKAEEPEEKCEEPFAEWEASVRVTEPEPIENVMPIFEKPRRPKMNPKLAKKKAFLESVLTRWQRNMGRFGKAA